MALTLHSAADLVREVERVLERELGPKSGAPTTWRRSDLAWPRFPGLDGRGVLGRSYAVGALTTIFTGRRGPPAEGVAATTQMSIRFVALLPAVGEHEAYLAAMEAESPLGAALMTAPLSLALTGIPGRGVLQTEGGDGYLGDIRFEVYHRAPLDRVSAP